MPVFTRVVDGVLHVIVDGDYTPDELRRKGSEGLDREELPKPAPVLLDMSGAAGMGKRSFDDIRQTGQFFGNIKERMTRVAIVAPSDLVFGLMNQGAVFAETHGLLSRPFRTRAEALAWLAGLPTTDDGTQPMDSTETTE